MMDIVEFLAARLDEDEAAAEAVEDSSTPWDGQWRADGASAVRTRNGHVLVYACHGGDLKPGLAAHVARHDPARVLREVAAKREILVEVMSWTHEYVDGDSWFSCPQAVDPHDEDVRPGSGCADEKRAGGPCECGLDRRRAAILHPLAAPHADHPDYDPARSLGAPH